MKKIFTSIWLLLIGCLLCLIVNFSANQAWIKEYHAGNFTENKLSFLGFFEPYISYYNKGNVYYQNGDYDAAIMAYQDALERHPSHDRECLIRINLVLAMVTPIDPDEIPDSQLADTIKLLEDAKEILYAHGCATEDGNGHNKDAQTLKEDIDRFEEELKERQENQTKEVTTEDDSQEKEEENTENQQDIERQLKEIQNQSTQERNQELLETETLEDFELYDGQTW